MALGRGGCTGQPLPPAPLSIGSPLRHTRCRRQPPGRGGGAAGDDLQHFLIKLIYVGKFQMSTPRSAKPVGEQKTCTLDASLPAGPVGRCMGAPWWERRPGNLTVARSRRVCRVRWALTTHRRWPRCDGDTATGGEHQALHRQSYGNACHVLPRADGGVKGMASGSPHIST